MLVTGVASIAGMSQLQFLVAATELSARDKLTGLYTRRFGEEIIESQFEVAERSEAPLGAVFVDLDLFKSVNDRYGHDAGDKVLQTAAQQLVAALPPSGRGGSLGRGGILGGDAKHRLR
jgi:GGDEF domain-containing protein